MSLYHETAQYLNDSHGSLKSRVYNSKNAPKSPAKQIYALASEAIKWSEVLSEVIEKAQLLEHEHKLTPPISLLLVHDLLLNKNGISAPAAHPLRTAVQKHKARLNSELSRIRIRRGFSNHGEFAASIQTGHTRRACSKARPDTDDEKFPVHPRWVRINTLKSSLREQLETTFAGSEVINNLEKLCMRKSGQDGQKLLLVDENIPNLMAVPRELALTKSAAYQKRTIIMQDKASCFPAVMLDPGLDGPCLDACAAPGNKTTHLAAMLTEKAYVSKSVCPTIYACERDKERSKILATTVDQAGAGNCVEIHPSTDFLQLNPKSDPWREIAYILLDPSCSGSGIIGRDDEIVVTLPKAVAKPTRSSKRKRGGDSADVVNTTLEDAITRSEDLQSRLTSLSNLQVKMLLHAFKFPKARRITYSTCSLHAEENELVVLKALSYAKRRDLTWDILERGMQVDGVRVWPIRGEQASLDSNLSEADHIDTRRVAEACIRCEKNTNAGTQGFFVATFVRNLDVSSHANTNDEWDGFSDASIP